jgi:predicted dehydrogenase
MFFPGGQLAMIQSSWLDPKKVREMTVVGTREMILYDDLEPLQKIKIYDQRVETPPHYDTFAEFQYAYHYGDMRAPHITQTEPLKVECGHFIECIQTGQTPLTDGRSGWDLVKVLEASSESLKRRGERVDL